MGFSSGDKLLEFLDPILIHLYRLTGYPLADYFLGTVLLALLAAVVGEFTISIVFKINRRHLEKLTDNVKRMNQLSAEALELGDKASYTAVNREGNDAYGHLFFNKFGLSASSLWPIFIALGWMQGRFSEIDLPLPFFGWSINYFFFFLLCYIPVRILFGRVKRRLPYFRGVHEMLLSYEPTPPVQK